MTRRGEKWVSSLWYYCLPLQLYCCISLFKAKYHQPPGRPILISWGSCGTPPSVQHKYPHAPVQMTPSDGEQYVKDLQSSSLNQLWQFTQSFVKSFDPALFKGSFFFFFPLIPHTPSCRGMRENLSALLWRSACCLHAVRPAAFPDLHCIVSVVLLVPRQNL